MRLVTSAVPYSSVALSPQRVGDVIAELAREHEIASLQTLIRRVFENNNEEARVVAQLSLASIVDELSVNERRQIARILQMSVNNSPFAASILYNSGNLVRRDDFDLARSLYQQAADKDPTYRQRGYWWGEQGQTYFRQGNYEEAARHYHAAVELGDRSSFLCWLTPNCGSAATARPLTIFGR